MFGNAVQDGALEVELHHDADGLGQSWVQGHRKVQGADLAGLDEPGEWRQRPFRIAVSVELGVVALFRRTEGPLDHRVVVEQGEKDGDAFHDGSAQLVLDPSPVVVEPPLYGLRDSPASRDRSLRRVDSSSVSQWKLDSESPLHAQSFSDAAALVAFRVRSKYEAETLEVWVDARI